jgi:hypothetical protein
MQPCTKKPTKHEIMKYEILSNTFLASSICNIVPHNKENTPIGENL